MSRWGRSGPPPEAYSRVTDAERFRPLHAVAGSLLAELEASFDVRRTDGYGLDAELEAGQLARPSTRLAPASTSAAPLVVAFTAFPGIRLRAGHWCVGVFPSCGCDACDETGDGEARRLRELVDAVVSGRFREELFVSPIRLPLVGDGWQAWEIWSEHGRSRSRQRIDAKRAQAMLASAGRPSIEWAAWPPRPIGR